MILEIAPPTSDAPQIGQSQAVFDQNASTLLGYLPAFATAWNTNVVNYNNDILTINNISDLVATSKTTTFGYMNSTLTYRNEAKVYRDEINGYVIPTEATLSPTAINDLIDTHKLENFLGFTF